MPARLSRCGSSNMCQGCLAHPCQEVCPKDADPSIVQGKSVIDQDKCIKCGRCVEACPYNAIIKLERPCAAGLRHGRHRLRRSMGRAKIDYDKCVVLRHVPGELPLRRHR